ncbi:ABC transporter substrate-binding protein [Brooklawnia sp.]|uniref:ABC transporter substrate-binding protein n=1 Tax=Brooklawnia sp. TaxID=2699740 RepID=UPI00311F2EB0
MKNRTHSWTLRVLGAFAALVLTAGCGATASVPDSSSTPSKSPITSSKSLAGYSNDGFPMTVTDFTGHVETFEQPPQRIAVVSGTPLSIFYDAGGTAIAAPTLTENLLLVDDRADEMRALPQLGLPRSIDSEALIGLNPDLVIIQAAAQASLESQLEQLGVPTFAASIKSLDDVTTAYEIFGALAGTSERASQRIAQITADTRAVVEQWPADDDTSVVILNAATYSTMIKLDDSVPGQMTSLLGVTNIASGKTPDNSGSDTTTLDIEAIVAAQPDYLLVTSMFNSNDEARAAMANEFASNTAWQAVDAVRDGKIVYLPQQYFLYNPGPHYADAARYLAASLRPDVYGDPVEPA